MIAALFLGSLLVGGLAAFGLFFDELEQPATLASALAIPSMIAATILVVRDRDMFSPLHLLLYMTIWSVALKTVYFLHFDPEGDAAFLSMGTRNPLLLDGGIWMIGVGITAFLAGYLITFPNSAGPSPFLTVTKQQRSVLIPFGFAVSFIAFAAIYTFLDRTGAFSEILRGQIFVKRLNTGSSGGVVAAQTYLRILGQSVPQVLFLMVLATFWTRPDLRKRSDYLLIFLLFIAAITIPLLASSRLTLAYLVLYVAMLRHYLVKPFSFFRLGAFAVAAIVVLGVLGELRRSQQSEFKFEADYRLTRFVETTLGRPYFLDIGKSAAVYDAVPSRVDFINGASLARLIYAPIPRAIWPEKPVLAINEFVRDKILERDDQSGVPPGGIAELYLNYGYPAVIIGMLLLGLVAGFNYRGLRRRARRSPFVVLNLMVTVVLVFTFLTVEIVTVVSHTAQILLPVLMVWLTTILFGGFEALEMKANDD